MSGELTDDDIKEMREMQKTMLMSNKEKDKDKTEIKNPKSKPKPKPKDEPQVISTEESMEQLEETKQEPETEMVTITKDEYERLKADLDLAKANIKIMADAMIYSDCVSMQRTGSDITRSLVLTTRQVVIYNEIKNRGIQQQNQIQNQ